MVLYEAYLFRRLESIENKWEIAFLAENDEEILWDIRRKIVEKSSQNIFSVN